MSANPWIMHVKAYVESHVGVTYGRALTLARNTYAGKHKKSESVNVAEKSAVMIQRYTMGEEDKCNKIQVFIKPCTESDKRCAMPYVGLPAPRPIRSSKGTYIYKALGWQMFGANPTRIPHGFRLATREEMVEVNLTPSQIRKMYCTPHRDLERDLEEGVPAMYLSAVANERGYCLSIQDVSSMAAGTCTDVILLDRNWTDVACEAYNSADGVVPAHEFLRMNRVRLCRTNNRSLLEFTLTSHEEEGSPMRIELHVEYAPGSFYPLRRGVLPAKDEQTGMPLLGKDIPWKELSPHLRVGWRGPMIPWEMVRHIEPLFCVR